VAYNEGLARRVRKTLSRLKAVSEIRMFGGLCFTLRGRMLCGVLKDDLVLRLSPEESEKALRAPHVRPMDFTGRPMKGFVYVGPRGWAGPGLAKWVRRAVEFAGSLPPKG